MAIFMAITFDDFQRVEMRVGRIVDVQDFTEAKKPAYKLKIDFGKYGIKQSSAQITKRYKKEDLLGRQVVAVTNFEPKKIAGFASEVLVLGFVESDGDVILISPDAEATLGNRLA